MIKGTGKFDRAIRADSAAAADTATTATRLTNGRTLTVSGDLSGTSSSFDGSGNVTLNAQIVANAVTSTEIASSAVTSAKILDGTIVNGDISDGTIQNAKLYTMTANTVKGRVTSNGVPQDLSVTQVINMIRAEFLKVIYPIGAIYMSVASTNPGTLFGGTWAAWGTGRVPVGINTTDTDFNTVEKQGGVKTQAYPLGISGGARIGLTTNAGNGLQVTCSPNFNIQTTSGTSSTTLLGGLGTENPNAYPMVPTALMGSTESANNMQPYITCYMWKRTA